MATYAPPKAYTPPKTDLETIVELLYSLFSQRYRGGRRPAGAAPQPSAHVPDNYSPNAQITSPESVWGCAEIDTSPYQDILRWLDELAPASARETAEENEQDNEAGQTERAEGHIRYSQPLPAFYSKSEYFQNILNNLYLGGSQPLGEYRGKLSERLESALAVELKEALAAVYNRQTGSSPAIQRERRQDRLDVVPVGKEIADGLYSLDLKVGWESWSHYSETTLMRVKTSSGVETIELDSSSHIAKAYRALDDKGLVGIFQKSEAGSIELTEILGLEGAKLNLAEGPGGNISINYHRPERVASDFEYINQELVLNPESRNHGYDFIRPVVVSAERASDSSLRWLTVTNEEGREEQYGVRNNSAIAIMADAMAEGGYTPEIRKMDVLSNDGASIESGIYIKNARRTGQSGQTQELITDTAHGGLWVELSKGSSRSEFLDPTGCSLNLERATPKAGQVIEARLGVVGRYDNRNYD